jgi:hypothetical protein
MNNFIHYPNPLLSNPYQATTVAFTEDTMTKHQSSGLDGASDDSLELDNHHNNQNNPNNNTGIALSSTLASLNLDSVTAAV